MTTPPNTAPSPVVPPILLLLGGGRGNVPNFWAARSCRPAHVYYLPCEDDALNLRVTEDYLKHHALPHTILDAVPAFEPESTKRACASVIRDAPETPVFINMTQSPALMAVGADLAARASGRGDVSVFHADTVRAVLYTVVGPPPVFAPFGAVVDDYLSAYSFHVSASLSLSGLPKTPSYYEGVAALLANPSAHFHGLMKQLTTPGNQKERRAGNLLSIAPLSPPAWSPLLQGLRAAGLITDLTLLPDGAAQFRTASEEAWGFLSGNWLKAYSASVARGLQDAHGRQVFADCRAGLHLAPLDSSPDGSFTLDLACITANGLLLCAVCRTQEPALVEGILDEIVSRADDLGRDYCVKMLITSVSKNQGNMAFYTKAAARDITVVCGEDLLSLPDQILAAVAKALGHSR